MILENLEELKNRFALELKYREYKKLDEITARMFIVIDDFIEGRDANDLNIQAIRKAKIKAKEAQKNLDLYEFIKQIDIICLLLSFPIISQELNIEIKDNQEIRNKKLEIEEWVKENKELKDTDMLDILRIQQKIFKILERI